MGARWVATAPPAPARAKNPPLLERVPLRSGRRAVRSVATVCTRIEGIPKNGEEAASCRLSRVETRTPVFRPFISHPLPMLNAAASAESCRVGWLSWGLRFSREAPIQMRLAAAVSSCARNPRVPSPWPLTNSSACIMRCEPMVTWGKFCFHRCLMASEKLGVQENPLGARLPAPIGSGIRSKSLPLCTLHPAALPCSASAMPPPAHANERRLGESSDQIALNFMASSSALTWMRSA